MAPLSWEEQEERRCKEFLRRFQWKDDPTWGFYVYGTYTRPQGQRVTDNDSDEVKGQEAAGKA